MGIVRTIYPIAKSGDRNYDMLYLLSVSKTGCLKNIRLVKDGKIIVGPNENCFIRKACNNNAIIIGRCSSNGWAKEVFYSLKDIPYRILFATNDGDEFAVLF